jgi:hypothetical protein
LVGLEYQRSNIAFDVGWFTPTDDNIGGVKVDALTRVAIGARYFMKPDENGLFGGLSYLLNDQAFVGVNSNFEMDTEGVSTLYATVGYRFMFGDRFDLTVGSGYGAALGLSDAQEEAEGDTGTVSIDLALGINLK